jgi:hypothetical protein
MGLYSLGDGWPKWVSCRKVSVATLWATLARQIIGINHSDEVAPPQAPPIYTKMVGNVPNTTMRYI